jgi:hypothetical protein
MWEMSDDIHNRVILGNEAKRLLSDPLFNGVLNVLTKDAISSLMKYDPGTPQAMSAHSDMKSYERIKQQLKSVQNDGAMAEAEARRHRD